LQIGDTGHRQIVEIYDEIKENYGFTEESIEKIKVESISQPIFQDSDVVGRKPRNAIEIDIDPDAMDRYSRITKHRDQSFRLLEKIDSEIEAGEQRVRLTGIVLLTSGFILQIPQYLS